jgi:hypothetical protein
VLATQIQASLISRKGEATVVRPPFLALEHEEDNMPDGHKTVGPNLRGRLTAFGGRVGNRREGQAYIRDLALRLQTFYTRLKSAYRGIEEPSGEQGEEFGEEGVALAQQLANIVEMDERV